MDVAISGDRASCLTQQLAPEMYLFAVANGFGTVEGQPVARAVLGGLRSEFEHRSRGDRLRRAEQRGKGISSSLLGAFSRVNEDMHARTASHDDYVTAGCSVTGALLIKDRAYLAHVGSTAAYLARDGYVVSLTKNDAFESSALPILTRAMVSAPTVEVAVCSFSLNEGDALVLAGRRLHEAEERRRVAESLLQTAHGGAGDQLLVIRYARADEPEVADASKPHILSTVLTGIFATIVFYALLCIK
jgi:serine/threonine protein phosphatase PrpC